MTQPIDDKISQACFDGFTRLIHQLTGISLKQERQTMLVGRLRKRVRALELSSFDEYLAYLQKHKEEHESFVNQVTTNETYFFRTPRVWDYLENTFLPEWQAERAAPTLQVWSAASSTGEEAHTLGILMQQFKDKNAGFDYKISGTDIDTNVIETASQGLYNGRSIERFRQAKPEWFAKYMHGSDAEGYKVVPDIKSRLQFSQFNLFASAPPAPQFDLVLLRNVLIYFKAQDQEAVMATVHRRLKPEGTAIIGESESLNNLTTDFESISPTIYKPVTQQGQRAA